MNSLRYSPPTHAVGIGVCAPYAISQATGLPYDQVLRRCKKYGWTERGGMASVKGRSLALDFEHLFIPKKIPQKTTLQKLFARLSHDKVYVIGCLLEENVGHWLAVVRGVNKDVMDSNMYLSAIVYECFEVSPLPVKRDEPVCPVLNLVEEIQLLLAYRNSPKDNQELAKKHLERRLATQPKNRTP